MCVTRSAQLRRGIGCVAVSALLLSGVDACGSATVSRSSPPVPTLACSSSTATVGTLQSPEAVVAADGNPFSILPFPGTDFAVASATTATTPPHGAFDVLRVGANTTSLVRSVALPATSNAYGMALSHNGAWLAVTTSGSTVLVSVAELLAGRADPILGRFEDGTSGQIEAAFSSDDRFLFVSDENSAEVSVFDVQRALTSGFTAPKVVVGQVLLSPGPVGIATSPDGRWIYVTTEGPGNGPGYLWVLNAQTAAQDPAAAIAGHVGAGCNPVRVALSPDGDVAWVTARASDVLIGFDTAELRTQPSRAVTAVVRVGFEPVGVAVYDGGRYAVVANSARFAGSSAPQNLTVVNLQAALAGRSSVVAWIAAGSFPREISIDGALGLVTNYDSGTVEAFKLPT